MKLKIISEDPIAVLGVDGNPVLSVKLRDDLPVIKMVAGVKGIKGDTGTAGVSGGSYVHLQSVPASTWTINHNLGYYPNVNIEDSAHTTIIADISQVSVNQLIINSNAAFSGKAYLS